MTLAQKREALSRAADQYWALTSEHTQHAENRDLPGAARMTATEWARHTALHTRRAAEARYLATVLEAARQILGEMEAQS